MQEKRLKIFTWHIHGSYLYYLSQGNYDLYVPVNNRKTEGYYGRGETFPFGDNVIEVQAKEVKTLNFDCILFQTCKNFYADQFEILSNEQQQLPRIYLEHNAPENHPTDCKHVVNDPQILLVHVTDYNKLMWQHDTDNIKVINHGISPVSATYSGEKQKGVVIVNHLHQRGRKLGADIFDEVRKHLPLDLVGMGTKEYGGLGEVLHPQLPAFISKYRFLFNPIRHTSLGLAVLESMMTGLPFVGIAATEYVTVVKNEVSGFIHTNIDYLIEKMKLLLSDKTLAKQLGAAGKETVAERFNINRFTKDWEETFRQVITKNLYHVQTNSIY